MTRASGIDVARPWLAQRAQASPRAEALAWRDPASGALRALDYASLAERADALARRLRALGVAPGDVVAMLVPSAPVVAPLVHAVHACGAAVLALNARLPDAELARQARRARARLVLTTRADASARPALVAACPPAAVEPGDDAGARIEWLASDVAGGADASAASGPGPAPARLAPCDAPLARRIDPEATAVVLFTSGTTSAPRGVRLAFRAFAASARASSARLGSAPGDRWLACMPLFHVGGLSILFRSVFDGTSALVHAGFDARAVARELDDDAITQASFVATMLARVLDERGARRAPARLRSVLLGGGPCPEPLLERAAALGYPVAPTYGLTEACSQVATRAPGDAERPLGAHLAPLDGTELRIAADGEILVRGPTLMTGYLDDAAATARALRDGWLHTGDVGALDARGRLAVLDRRDDLIVSGGENVAPARVEAVLCAHPAVEDAAVVARADAEFGARPFAFVVRRAGAELDADALRAFCRERLAGYEVPVGFAERDALPRTASGKLRRGELRAELARAEAR
ncbi:MAG: o-succinylbenzoate--CoA ligase [Myxococcota bacterium]